MSRLLSIVSLLALAACIVDGPSAVACTNEGHAGLVVYLLDSITGRPVTGPALVIASDAAFADTAQGIIPAVYQLAYNRAGTYRVTAAMAGYADWHRSPVVVARDRCHVRTVTLTALLSR